MIAQVVVDVENNQVNRIFDYNIPTIMEDAIEVGHRVRVPFGRRKLLGFVVSIKDKSSYDDLKDIIELLDIKPIITEELISLSSYMVKRYYTFYITVLKQMIPTSLKVKYLKKIHIKDASLVPDDIKKLFKNDFYKLRPQDEMMSVIKKLEAKGAVEVVDDFEDKGKTKSIKMVALKDEVLTYKSAKAQMVLDFLSEISEPIEKKSLNDDMGISDSVLKTLEEHGNIEIYEIESYRSPDISEVEDKKVILNTEQKKAYDEIYKSLDENKGFLLHGVCGSGKTEIYLNLIEDVIKKGREAIMLVPEISLTPQMTQRFKARFKDIVAVLHSRLSQGERYDEWRKILNGDAKIVVGARSAIFAPFKNLGLIIIDEEHEKSYIQDTNPKYDAIDVAEFRAKYHNVPLILGSATPRIDSYTKAVSGEYMLLELPKRANGKEMEISKVVDMREELKNGNRKMFSGELLSEIKATYERHEQSILFLNRRGFATFVMCRSCGAEIKCPNCDVSLTYHKSSNRLKCHYCGHEEVSPTKCPVCDSTYIRYVGLGTEKIATELEKEIPGIRITRVDLDTTREKNSYQKLFDSFKNHESDVLVGTQIIAKGLDFPLVSLVGVVNADIGLKMPTYDSQEVSFDLLEQVSGRAGRDKTNGRVIIQTYNPEHYAIKYASLHDYKGFYNEEIRMRRISLNPPFTERVEITVSSESMKNAHIEAVKIVNSLKTKASNSKIYGPTEDFRFKLKNKYHYVITCKFDNNDCEQALLYITEKYQNSKDVVVSITRV